MKLTLEITASTTEEQLRAVLPALLPVLAAIRASNSCAGTCAQQVTVGHANVRFEAPTAGEVAELAAASAALAGSGTTYQQHDPDVACRECGFYSPCKCEVGNDQDEEEQIDTAAIFGNSPLNALSTAAVGQSTIAPTTPGNTGAENAAPTNAANAAPVAPPAPTAAGTANPAGSAEVDIHGVIWDARIHARTKAKIGDGSWRGKRNVDPALVAQVLAEQRAAGGQQASVAPVTPDASVAPVTPPAQGYIPKPGEVVTPPASQAPAAPAPAPFPLLMRQITAHIRTDDKPENPLTYDQINFTAAQLGLVDSNGVGAMGFLATKPELIPAFRQMIDAILAPAGRVLGD